MPKKLSPAIFGFAIICFFLPWFHISCQGQKMTSFTGIQLVTGTTIDEPQMFGPPKQRKINGLGVAIWVFLAAILGGLLSLLKDSSGPAVTGGLGVVLLFILKAQIDGDLQRQSGGMLQADYDSGFYLTLICFIAAIAINVFFLVQNKGSSLPQVSAQRTVSNYCHECGAKIETGALFCTECGHSLK